MNPIWIDLTQTIFLLKNKYQWEDYISCIWRENYWDIEGGHRPTLSTTNNDCIRIYISHFKTYMNLRQSYIDAGCDLDELIDYLHELICMYVNDKTLNSNIILRYIDRGNTTFIRSINKKYIKKN